MPHRSPLEWRSYLTPPHPLSPQIRARYKSSPPTICPRSPPLHPPRQPLLKLELKAGKCIAAVKWCWAWATTYRASPRIKFSSSTATIPQLMERETARLEAFSDGIFGIAMTLLILEFRVHALPHDDPDPKRQLLHALLAL